MRLGWSKKGNSVSYYVQKTIYVNGKNKSQVIKRLGSEKYICETYGVTDAKAWALEQVELMRLEEADENSSVNIHFLLQKIYSMTNSVVSTVVIFSYRMFTTSLVWIVSVKRLPRNMILSTTSIPSFPG